MPSNPENQHSIWIYESKEDDATMKSLHQFLSGIDTKSITNLYTTKSLEFDEMQVFLEKNDRLSIYVKMWGFNATHIFRIVFLEDSNWWPLFRDDICNDWWAENGLPSLRAKKEVEA